MKKTFILFLISFLTFGAGCELIREYAGLEDDFKPSIRKSQNVVEIVIEEEDLSILEAAVIQAGLVETLQNLEDQTIFAPTDQAFIDAGIDLSTISTEDLTAVLTYHVIAAQTILSKSLESGGYTTANGADLFVDNTDEYIFINGNTEVIRGNIVGKNGVIHKIDKVLLPPTQNIVEVAVAATEATPSQFNALVAAVLQAELATALSSEGPFTVFAPTDEAFGELLEALREQTGNPDLQLADIDNETLTSILLYHVVPARVFSPAVMTGEIPTLNTEATISAAVDGDAITLNGDVNVVGANVLATNGVIHVIDKVLLPPTDDEEEPESNTIVDIAVADEQFSTLVAALTAADLVTALQGEGPFTVFAPTNEAFDNLPDGVVEALLKDKELLTKVLLLHVAEGSVTSDDLRFGFSRLKMLNKERIRVLKRGSGKIKVFDRNEDSPSSDVILKDVIASNGVIHVIDEVLIPAGFDLDDFEDDEDDD